jgi:hypothetical protein
MSTRQIALVAGIVGAVLGIAAMVTDAAALGLMAGLLALAAGVLAVTGRPTVEKVHPEVEQAYNEATAELATARKVLDEQRSRILELEAAVGEAEADPVAAALGEGAVLTDPDTGLLSESYFRVALDARIASARRHLRPVAVAFIDVAEGQVAGTAVAAPPERVAAAVSSTVRDADTGALVDDLVRTHQVWMHMIITRDDLGTFAHLHPEPTSTAGTYRDLKARDVIINGATNLLKTSAALTDNAAAQVGTLTNAPTEIDQRQHNELGLRLLPKA